MSLGSSDVNDENARGDEDDSPPSAQPPVRRSPAEVQDWMVSYLARHLNTQPEEIDVTVPFENCALDSAAAIEMTGDLEVWLAARVDPMMVYDYPTIKDMAHYLGRDAASENEL